MFRLGNVKRLILPVAFCLVLALLVARPAWTQPDSQPPEENQPRVKDVEPNKVAGFMRVKLKQSQTVLEGLTMENYKLIAKASHDMTLMSQATNWQVLQTPEYLERSVEFRRATRELTQAAERKNLEAAALAYMDVTLKCVECHKYVRRVQPAEQ